jgi:hypothetical protein
MSRLQIPGGGDGHQMAREYIKKQLQTWSGPLELTGTTDSNPSTNSVVFSQQTIYTD